jgi:hypothetical protein
MCHLGEYIATQPFYLEIKTFEYVFSNRIAPKTTGVFYVKAMRHFNKGVTQRSIPWIEAVEQFTSYIHTHDTPKNNAYAKNLLQWAHDALQQKNEKQVFFIEESPYREFLLTK